jgi:hypothetical protein
MEPLSPDSYNRKGNLLGGIPFTSKEHTWPINRNGKPYYPLTQINLTGVSSITNKEFGDGILQVWIDVDEQSDWMSSVIKRIEPNDLDCEMEPHEFEYLGSNFNELWCDKNYEFSFEFNGYVCPSFDSIDRDDFVKLSKNEKSALERLELIAESNGWKSIDGDWLLGYPDMGSGSPAGSYFSEVDNFIQLATFKSFPMTLGGKQANIFYSDSSSEVEFWFDWGG